MTRHLLNLSVIALLHAPGVSVVDASETEDLLSLSLAELVELDVFISTNTRRTLSQAPSVVSVITAEDIKATGATNLAEILESVPGIYIKPNLFGFRPQIRFRGASGAHTLLMVNGNPVRDLVWNAGIFWRGLPTSIIERVEVIRGPGSALFGADASAGAINIITKTANGIAGTTFGLRAGTFDTQTGWAQHGWQWNDFEFALTADISRTDGHDPLISRDSQSARDASDGTAASFAPGHADYGWRSEDIRFSAASGHWQLNTDYRRQSDLGIGLTGYGALDPRTRGEDEHLNLDLIYDNPKIASDWALRSKFNFQHMEYASGDGFFERPPGFRDDSGLYPDGLINQMRSAQRDLGMELSGLFFGWKGHEVRLGGGYERKDLYSVEQAVNFGNGPDGETIAAGAPLQDLSDTPYAFAPEKARAIRYLFLQDIWALSDDWELTAGARYDHYSDFGDALVPRLALVWKSTERLTSKLMYGEAFRAPSYLELYAPTAATQPNPNLTPEKSKTWDLSFVYNVSSDLKLNMSFYHFSQFDLIGLDEDVQFQNMGSNHARGIEFEAVWQPVKTLRFSGNYSARDDETPYNSVPKKTAYLRADWTVLPDCNWNLQANWIGEHSLPPDDGRDPIGDYTVVDSTLRYAYDQRLELAVSVHNLLDEDAREHSSRSISDNLPLPGRSLYFELRYKL